MQQGTIIPGIGTSSHLAPEEVVYEIETKKKTGGRYATAAI
jgi:hypothetical protein